MNMTNKREITVHIKPIEVDNEVSVWIGTLELDGEQIAERRGKTFEALFAEIYKYCSEENSVLPQSWLKAHGGTPIEATN